MKTKLMMIMTVIAIFAVSLNLHSSNEEVVFGVPSTQMMRGGSVYCAFNTYVNDCIWTINGIVCIDWPSECGNGVEVGPQEPDPNQPTTPPAA